MLPNKFKKIAVIVGLLCAIIYGLSVFLNIHTSYLSYYATFIKTENHTISNTESGKDSNRIVFLQHRSTEIFSDTSKTPTSIVDSARNMEYITRKSSARTALWQNQSIYLSQDGTKYDLTKQDKLVIKSKTTNDEGQRTGKTEITILRYNMIEYTSKILLIICLIIYIFSKEKIHDERIQKLQLRAFSLSLGVALGIALGLELNRLIFPFSKLEVSGTLLISLTAIYYSLAFLYYKRKDPSC